MLFPPYSQLIFFWKRSYFTFYTETRNVETTLTKQVFLGLRICKLVTSPNSHIISRVLNSRARRHTRIVTTQNTQAKLNSVPKSSISNYLISQWLSVIINELSMTKRYSSKFSEQRDNSRPFWWECAIVNLEARLQNTRPQNG